MKSVLVTSSGGAPATGVVRSFNEAPEDIYTVGVDSDSYTICRSVTDEAHLVPPVDDPDYLPILQDIIREKRIDFVHVQISKEIATASFHRESLGARTFLPSHDTIETLDDKLESFRVWQNAGLPVPETVLIKDFSDLKVAFDAFGPKIWVRAIKGSAGRGSLPTDRLHIAKAWIDFHEGWGEFTASECLSDKNIAWQSIWKNGELLAAQSREILTWEFGNRAPSGVSGSAGVGETVSSAEIDQIGLAAVHAVDKNASGAFSVDITYDVSGNPKITEINCGRFPTTGHFLTRAGLNLPYIYLKAGFDEEIDLPLKRINPLENGLLWVRGMDIEPVMTNRASVVKIEEELAVRRERVRSGRLVPAS